MRWLKFHVYSRSFLLFWVVQMLSFSPCSSCLSVWLSWAAGLSSRQMPLRVVWAKPRSCTLPSSSWTRTTWASPLPTGCSPCGTIHTLLFWSASGRWATPSKTDEAGRGSGDRCPLRTASADLSWLCDAPWSTSSHLVLYYFNLYFTSQNLQFCPLSFSVWSKIKLYRHKTA